MDSQDKLIVITLVELIAITLVAGIVGIAIIAVVDMVCGTDCEKCSKQCTSGEPK